MTLVQFLSGWIVRSSILVLSGAALIWLLRLKNPSIRLAALTAMLVGSLAIPFLGAVLPQVPIAVGLATVRPSASVLSVATPATNYMLRIPRLDSNPAPAPPPPASATPFDWMRPAATLYALAVCLLLLRLVLGIALSIRVFRRSRRTGLNVEGTQVRESDRVASPVTVGVFRPAMLLPLDWREWDSAKLNAVLAHERSHIRRLDPAVQLLSAIHRALLWPNPLSWFLHRSIVRTAEEVSDGDAIAATGDRDSYAEILLGLMQRGVGQSSWLGVPMALYDRPERRIRRVLNSAAVTCRLTGRSIAAIVLLGAPLAWLTAAAQTRWSPQPASVPAPIGVIGMLSAGIAPVQVSTHAPDATLVPQMIAQVRPAPSPSADAAPTPSAVVRLPEFTAAEVRVSPPAAGRVVTDGSISGGRFEIRTATMRDLIMFAYDVGEEMVVGGPTWLAEDRFDVTATAPADTTRESQALMLRVLLRDRFGLLVHNDKRPLPAFSMTVAKRGVQMTRSSGSGPSRCEMPPQERVYSSYTCKNMTMTELAKELSGWGGTYFWVTPVVDETKLAGAWDFTLKWTPRPQTAATVAAGSEAISIFDAVDKQLGLKLDLTKLPLDAIIVDRVNEKPTNPSSVTEKQPMAAPTQFEVAAVKPSDPSSTRTGMSSDPGGRVIVQGYSLKQLIAFAWNVDTERIINGSNFVDSERFDITAKAFGDDVPSTPRLLDQDSVRVMMRALLVARFKLAVHNEDRPEPAYVLTAGKPKMKLADPSNRSDCQNVPTPGGGPRPRMMTCQNTTMAEFTAQLMRFAPGYLHATPVVNESGINGAYDIALNFSPAQMLQNDAADSDPNGAISLFDAIDKELGLKLELQKRPMPVVVIDHLEQKPAEN